MTDTPEFAAADPLPGLEAPRRGDSPLRKAAHRTITALSDAGFLDERHALITQLILDLADVHESGRVQGRASASAMAAAQIIAAYVLLMPEAMAGGDGDEWAAFVAEVRRSTAETRYTADARPEE